MKEMGKDKDCRFDERENRRRNNKKWKEAGKKNVELNL